MSSRRIAKRKGLSNQRLQPSLAGVRQGAERGTAKVRGARAHATQKRDLACRCRVVAQNGEDATGHAEGAKAAALAKQTEGRLANVPADAVEDHVHPFGDLLGPVRAA